MNNNGNNRYSDGNKCGDTRNTIFNLLGLGFAIIAIIRIIFKIGGLSSMHRNIFPIIWRSLDIFWIPSLVFFKLAGNKGIFKIILSIAVLLVLVIGFLIAIMVLFPTV